MLIPDRPFTPRERKLYLANRCGYLYRNLLLASDPSVRNTAVEWESLQWFLDYESSLMRQGYLPCARTQDQPEVETICSRSYLSHKAGYLVEVLQCLTEGGHLSSLPREWESFQQHLGSAYSLSLCEWGQEELLLEGGGSHG